VRVRPVIKGEKDEASGEASIAYPDQRDHKEIQLEASTESAMGSQRKEITSFSFDKVSSLILREAIANLRYCKVFEPKTSQAEIFDEVSQLVQSVIDGYNVTIFAYGQTGSGKSFTMEGGHVSNTVGPFGGTLIEAFIDCCY
jgi:kinesin family protein C1